MGFFDPLGAISDAMSAAYLMLVGLFQQLIAQPITFSNNSFTDYLYGNALGVYQYLALCVTFVTMISAMLFVKKMRANFAIAVLVLLLVTILGPLWFAGGDYIESFGDELTNAARSVSVPDGSKTSTLPELKFDNVVIGILVYFYSIMFGTSLYSIFLYYEVMIPIIKFLGLISLSLLAMGDRALKIFNMLVSSAIVIMVLGRPVAMLIINVGQGLISVIPNGTNMFNMGIITIGSLVLGIVAQPLLLFLAYKGVVSPVSGRIASEVRGKVTTLSDKRIDVTAKSVSASHAASLRTKSDAISARTKKPEAGYATRFKQEAVSLASAKAAAMLAARLASNAHPAAKVAVTVAAVAAKATQTKGARR